MRMLFLTHLLVILLPSVYCICPDTVSCINRVREVVAGPKRFWFGEHRRAQCNHRNANPIDCFGPSQLSSFHSLGSRLFRVRTYHSAYLRNLVLFPRVTYRAAPGDYRACDHEYHSPNSSSPVEVDPDMAPVAPYAIRHKPEIGWQDLKYNDEFTILMVDVGFGTLNYLVTDFPNKPKVLKEYEPSANFRALSNPLVVLIFKKGSNNLTFSNSDDFDLSKFMMKNELEDNLIGMNIVVVGSDPFAIEKQRLLGNVDNCHSLLYNKLHRHPPSRFLSPLPMNEISQWISVSFESPKLDANVCCQRIRQSASTVFLDPIGDLSISALSTLSPPSFTSLHSPTAPSTYTNYHRQARTYVALMDELFTLVAIDGVSGKLHWMVVDIAAAELENEGEKGQTKAAYHPLIPFDAASCRPYVFVLFEQTSSLGSLEGYCEKECLKRRDFRLDSFKQRHGLRLAAVNWVTSCFDLPYSYHVLSAQLNHTEAVGAEKKVSALRNLEMVSSQVCAAFKVSPLHKCRVYSSSIPYTMTYTVLSIMIFLFNC